MAGAEDVTTNLMAGPPSVAFAAVDLYVVSGPDRGMERRIPTGRLRVGTGAGSDLCLTDPTVSRLHFEIVVKKGGLRLVDLDSTNGTFVNGVRVYDAELSAGGTITVGATALRVEVAGEPVRVELSRGDRFGDVLGGSVEMRRIYAILERVAPTEATVLVQGETGTGKEAVARAIHESSRRDQGPFVAVDCGAIAEALIESELFGHVRGAFSGAVADRRGLFEQANGGTLFLDEIGELPLSLQPKLLRALEMREVRPVGSNVPRRVDVRVVAATNRPLARSVNEGTFREDLYYRLAVLEVALPPLRARREDIPRLAQHFYERFAGARDPLPKELVSTLMARAWPGNVRELRNFVERSVSLGWSGDRAAGVDRGTDGAPPGLCALVPTDRPLKEARAEWTAQFEALYVSAILRRADGNVTRAAEMAGVNRRSLQRLMAEHRIRSGTGDDDAPEGGDPDEDPIDDAPRPR